jgi:hypothetical protein
MARDMICVYHAADVEQAEVIAVWLRERGIEAHVKDAFAATNVYVPLAVAPQGIEVCVMDPDQAERAVEMLREHFAAVDGEHEPDQAGQMIEVKCEECGESAKFQARERGTVQSCPHCGGYVDVPQA